MYLITFKHPTNSSLNETLGFYEPEEVWHSFYSFTPDRYANVTGRPLMMFIEGRIYINDSPSMNYFKSQYHSEVWVVGNQYPDDAKDWNSLEVNSNDVWAPSAVDGVIVDPDMTVFTHPTEGSSHVGAMQSSLKPASFRYVNGSFVAEFLRDATSSTGVFSVNDLIKGRPLSGKTILLKLVNTKTTPVYLYGVRINAQKAR